MSFILQRITSNNKIRPSHSTKDQHNANIYAFKKIGASVVGISVDDVDSHRAFAEKYRLPFILLADTGGSVSKSYGVLRDWKLMKIAARQSFIIDPNGQVVKHYEDVDPDTHTQEVLADIEALMKSPDYSGT